MATTMEENFKFGLDIHFAQRLAGNVTKIRERTVKKLKRWIAARSLKQGDVGMETELMRLWKGLFYCMWMCDKPVIQEEMADKIAELVHSFTTPKGAMAFFDAFLLTMKREWIGIDRLRMDKFFMFIRRCLRQVLVVLRNNNWEDSIVEQFLAVLCKTPLSADPEASPDGLRYHFIDIYKEELARCAGQELTPSVQVMKLIDPFCVLVTTTRNKTLLKVILRGFFQEIIDESDVGFLDESEDEGIDSGEEEKEEGDKDEGDKEKEENEENLEEEDNEEEEEVKKKYVRKERPKLKYDYEAIAERLFTLASQQSTPGFVRRKVYTMVKKFRDLKEGVFPDYNVGSLMDYQDDDDETEQKYGDRPPPEKQKKPRRRGGKQVRERRLAKAQIETAREAQQAGKRFADDSDEEEWMDEKAEEKKEDQKKKKRRRRKKKLKKVDGETEEATTTGAAGEKEKSSETEDGKKEPEEGDESSKQEEIVKKESIVEEKKAVEEIIATEAKPSPGTDEPDGGTKKKRGRKRKSEASQNEVAVPVLDHDDAQKESETADNEETKMDAMAMETAVATETASPSAGSETKSNRKQKGKQGKQKSNVGGVERGEASNLGDSVDAADKSDAMQSKEEINAPKDEVQINLFPVSELSKDSATTTKDTSLQLSTGSSQKLSAGGKKKTEQPFAAFQTVSTPPALVRRKVVRKAGEPKTEPPRKTKSRLSGVSDDSDQPTPRKRVKIALGLNKAHASKDYKKQLESSPGIPFDGSKKPTQSVLKTPSPKPRPPTKKKTATPTFKTPSPKIIKEAGLKSSAKKRRSPKTAPNLRRSSRLKPTHK